MKKDDEYVLTGLFSNINAPFLYRKATLIAVVGEGGWGGHYWKRWCWGGKTMVKMDKVDAGSGGGRRYLPGTFLQIWHLWN